MPPLVTMTGSYCVTVRYEGTTPGGGVGVVGGESKLPSLADTIAAVRRELGAAQAAGAGQPVQFRTGPVELEFEVAVTRTGGGQAGVQLWVLTLGGKAELGQPAGFSSEESFREPARGYEYLAIRQPAARNISTIRECYDAGFRTRPGFRLRHDAQRQLVEASRRSWMRLHRAELDVLRVSSCVVPVRGAASILGREAP
jgi:Trypsin-co-occurring domain 2